MAFFRNLFLLVLLVSFGGHAEADQDFFQDKTKQQGFFSFLYQQDSGKVFLEIEKFEQEFLFQGSLARGVGSNDIGLDRGQLGDTRIVQFERVGKKVFLRQINTYYRANTENVLEKEAMKEAFASSIIWGFDVAHSANGKTYIDYTPFLLSDSHNLASKLSSRKQGNYSVDNSRSGVFLKRTKAFPKNTELEATVTFKGKGTGKYIRSVAPDANAVTVNLHHSLVELPDDNYQPRVFHPYSGFWEMSYMDYGSQIDQSIVQRLIPRHRLAKKNPNAKVSEAIEPIIYYLDAGVPEPVRSALLDGARWWDQAFAAIGYKNAFQVKMLPSDADPMDVRYNVIQWVHRATRGWSYGSAVTDPRTGEIIKGHVTLGSLRVRQDYLIALGLTSPFEQKETDTTPMKDMALARIRQLSAHEVGHTIGIAHNFAASVNDRASVMDYPHPLVTLKDGKVDLSNAYAEGIGEWDKHTIAYGYADVKAEDESQYLLDTVANAQKLGLQFISDPDARSASTAHSTAHLWDNGKDPVNELDRMLKVRKVALDNFGLNSIPHGAPLSELEPVLVPIYNFHRFQVAAAAKLIAGVNYQYQLKQDNFVNAMSVVDAKTQQRAITSLLNTLSVDTLALPKHISDLIPPKAYGYSRDRESFVSGTGITFDPISAAEANAKHTLQFLLNGQRLARLQQQAMGNSDIPSVDELLEQLLKVTIKSTPEKGTKVLVQQRVNQQLVEQLLGLWHQKGLVTEVRANVYVALNELQQWLTKKQDSRKYDAHSAQYQLLARQINYSLAQGKLVNPVSTMRLPPGSPIGN